MGEYHLLKELEDLKKVIVELGPTHETKEQWLEEKEEVSAIDTPEEETNTNKKGETTEVMRIIAPYPHVFRRKKQEQMNKRKFNAIISNL